MNIKKLTRKENIKLEMRETPRQLNSPDLGSPKKVWRLLCEKDESAPRNSNIFHRHPRLDSKMRSVLLEWLMEVCYDRRLHRETYHLCMDYIDKYLEKARNILPHQLQLLGSTALVIATKMEEIYPPKISEIADFTDGTCSDVDIRSMEENMLQVLEWNCTPITAIHWLGLYMQLMSSSEISPEFSASKQNAPRRRSTHHQLNQVSPCSSAGAQSFSCSNGSLKHEKLIESNTKTEFGLAEETDTNDEDFAGNLSATALLEMSYIGYQSYSDGHVFPDQRCTVPKLMRDEFIRLAMILDVVMLDIESLQFKYSELAAAVIWCCYEPENLVQEVTGFHREQLYDVFEFVEPCVLFCEHLEPAGITIPSFSEILAEDAHNIQAFIPNLLKNLEIIRKRRLESIETRRRAINYRSRKRKLCEINGN